MHVSMQATSSVHDGSLVEGAYAPRSEQSTGSAGHGAIQMYAYMSASINHLEEHLSRFGLSSFRPGQRDVIAAVLANRDCLCIMPTGGGKSLCYQLPSI